MLNVENILVARDFSEAAQDATRYALDLATRTGAMLHTLFAEVLHGDPFDPSKEPSTAIDKIRERLKQTTEEQVRGAYDPDSVRLVHAVERDIAAGPAILRYADEQDIDLIVMGTHGRRGVRRMALGSVAEEVIRRAECPVLTVGRREEKQSTDGEESKPQSLVHVRRMLVPVDFSDHSREALRHAKALSDLYEQASLELFHVIEETLHPAFYSPAMRSIYDAQPNIEEKAIEKLEEFYHSADGPGEEASFGAGPGRAPQAIAEHARQAESDLIVMATHGRTGLERVSLGSVAEKVVRLASCPVLTVKSFGKSLLRDFESGERASGEAEHESSDSQ